ncbi:hypothetical protein A2U01_0109933, partial [Trifolium medium]|nr:hypothetical protein [Trifolium medium]
PPARARCAGNRTCCRTAELHCAVRIIALRIAPEPATSCRKRDFAGNSASYDGFSYD